MYEISRYDAEYKAAVDGEPAGARIYNIKKCMVISSVKKNVPRASAHYADRYGKKQRIEQVVRLYAALRAAPVCDSASYYHSCAYEQRVPSDVEPEKRKRHGVWCKVHFSSLLNISYNIMFIMSK